MCFVHKSHTKYNDYIVPDMMIAYDLRILISFTDHILPYSLLLQLNLFADLIS